LNGNRYVSANSGDDHAETETYQRPAHSPGHLHARAASLRARRGDPAILENKQKHQELSDQMRHVEAVIKLLDPGYNLGRIAVKRRQPNKWFKRGTLYRRALDVLRMAEQPMTTTEIAAAVLKAHGADRLHDTDPRVRNPRRHQGS
jgi:hypothetical protein